MMKSIFSSILQLTLLLFSGDLLQAQWIRQYPMDKLEDVLDIDVSSDGYGFAVGSNDLLLRTLAGNNQWELLPGFGEGWRFEAVDYLEGTGGNVAAAGGDGFILTLDKGAHWNEIAGAPAGIHTIKIFSITHIIVASDDGMYEWENGIWTDLNVPNPVGLKGAFILNDQVMWANTLATSPAIYYTTNGGMNWSTNLDLPRVDVVRFFDVSNGIATDGRDVYQSVNGGQNWTMIADNGLKNSANDLTFGSSLNVLVAATPNAKPNISTDGGLTWEDITTPLINQRSFSVSAVSDTDFWIGNDLSGVMHSSDGGTTWEETSGPVRNLIQDVYFINRTIGFALGTKGMLLRTFDGGEHWEDKTFGTRSHLSIHGLSVKDLWLGTNQRILHSIDTGNTWTEAGVFASGNISDVLAISSNRILAASTTGNIYLSSNGGMTWDSVYHSGAQMRSLAKIDDQHYMATGFNGVIVRSDNQGQTWHSVTIPEPGLQYEQSFFLNGEGWLVTSSFKKAMWHTTNGGDTWDTLALPIDRFWDGVYFISPDTGIVVARSTTEGRAYITFDGAHHWQSGYITSFPLYGVTGVPNPNGTAWIFGYGSDIEVLPYCNSFPFIANFIGDLFPCQNDTVVYTITSQNVDLFTWHFPPGWQIIGNSNNDTVQVRVGSNSGNITVSGSNPCGTTGQLSFSAGPDLLPVVSQIIGDMFPCQGSIVSYSATGTSVNDYSWSLPGDWVIEGNTNQASIMVHVGSMGGFVSVIGSNQCGSSAPAELDVATNSLPTITFLSGELMPCAGDTVVFTFETQIENSFTVTVDGLDDWSLLNSQFPNTIRVIAGNFPGILHVFAVNDCGSSIPADLELNPLYVPEVGVLADSGKLYPTVLGISYQWYLNDQPIPGATEYYYTPVVSGTYAVIVTLDNGCLTKLSLPVTVVITGVKDLNSPLPLVVYPVPASDELFLHGITGEFKYTIIDLAGKNILQNYSRISKIQTSNLSEGMYLIKVETAQQSYLAKFIISRED